MEKMALVKQVIMVILFLLVIPMWLLYYGSDGFATAIVAIMLLIIPIVVFLIYFGRVNVGMARDFKVARIGVASVLWISGWFLWIVCLNGYFIQWADFLHNCLKVDFAFSFWIVIGSYNTILLSIAVIMSYFVGAKIKSYF